VRRQGRAGRLLLIALAACGGESVAPVNVPSGAPDAAASAAPASPPPRAGTACKIDTQEICLGANEALACHRGVWEAERCSACALDPKTSRDVCEQTVAESGEICNLTGDFVCTSSAKAMMKCAESFRWTEVQGCHGERGCVVDRKKLTCDNSVASAGDACMEEDDYACSADAKVALVCHKRVFGVASGCAGKKGCRVVRDEAEARVECDDSVANLGDPCEKDGHYACAMDEKSILRCKDKKFIQDDHCKKKERCQIRAGQVGCY
jgi:hypothetical protein